MYVTDRTNSRVCVWFKECSFQRGFKTKYAPTYIAATGDNHLLITCSCVPNTVMVYTLEGQLVHEFRGSGSAQGRFRERFGICVGDSEAVFVADCGNKLVHVF